jgi:DNA-binding CsgD family transcriptional regulator
MRGYPITDRQRESILRLAGYLTVGGEWKHSDQDIADLMHLDHRTVWKVLRKAAAKWGSHTRWKSEEFPENP